MRILVVDDEKIKRITLADDLAAQGHEVAMAGDGDEALEKLSQGRFDVVVTDLKMPKLDGIELLKRIKQGPLADMEVIMMTAYGSIPVAVEAVKLGAFDFRHQAVPQRRHLPAAGPHRARAESAPPSGTPPARSPPAGSRAG